MTHSCAFCGHIVKGKKCPDCAAYAHKVMTQPSRINGVDGRGIVKAVRFQHTCPKCDSKDIVRNGHNGEKQIYRCNACKYYFSHIPVKHDEMEGVNYES